MTGGRWRRIVLGDVLAEHVVELRGRARVSCRGGSGSFGSGRTAGYAIGEDRTSPWLEAIAGIRGDHVPGWAPSPCRLPGPVTRYETCLRRVLTAATVSSTPFRFLDTIERDLLEKTHTRLELGQTR